MRQSENVPVHSGPLIIVTFLNGALRVTDEMGERSVRRRILHFPWC